MEDLAYCLAPYIRGRVYFADEILTKPISRPTKYYMGYWCDTGEYTVIFGGEPIIINLPEPDPKTDALKIVIESDGEKLIANLWKKILSRKEFTSEEILNGK